MIVFKKIKYKNFLSTGNIPIEIDLNKSHTTLIVGSNGCLLYTSDAADE